MNNNNRIVYDEIKRVGFLEQKGAFFTSGNLSVRSITVIPMIRDGVLKWKHGKLRINYNKSAAWRERYINA